VNIQTLRYYERRGLLRQPPRQDSGYRSYGAEAVGVVRFIKRAQELGFTLSEVEMLLDLANGGPKGCEAVKALANHKLHDLESKMTSLHAMHESLERLVATGERPKRQRECPLIDALGSVAGVPGIATP
jgi:DNA-binding transcriptional MerR regulator